MKRFWIAEGNVKSIDGSVGSHDHQDMILATMSVWICGVNIELSMGYAGWWSRRYKVHGEPAGSACNVHSAKVHTVSRRSSRKGSHYVMTLAVH